MMDGNPFVTGSDGMASVEISKVGQYRLDALTDLYHNPDQQVQFGRWESESYLPYRMVQVPTNDVIMAGLNIFHQVGISFIDLDGYPVDSSRVTAVTVRSLQGDVFDLKVGSLQWLPSSRTARRQTGLEETDLLYSIIDVTIDGSNVVNSAQQKFFLTQNTTWKISLLLYTLHVAASDGLFGTPLGKSIDLQFPNGLVQNYPLDHTGNIEVHTLARGIYHATLVGASGMGTNVPVALSRQQYVNMKVVTPKDMAVAGIAGVSTVLGLIFYGRPWILLYLLKKRRAIRDRAYLDISTHDN